VGASPHYYIGGTDLAGNPVWQEPGCAGAFHGFEQVIKSADTNEAVAAAGASEITTLFLQSRLEEKPAGMGPDAPGISVCELRIQLTEPGMSPIGERNVSVFLKGSFGNGEPGVECNLQESR
jgi:hypothetical protein